MKIQFSKILALLMALMLMLGAVGCGGKKTSSGTDVGSSENNEAAEEIRNLEGRTIKFLANWTEPVKGNSDRENVYWAKKTEIEKNYNCKYEHIYLSDETVYDTFISSILSGDPMADIVCYKKNPYPAIRQGLFYDLSKLKEFDFEDEKWLKSVSDMGMVDNKQYLMFSNKFVALNLIFYNKEIFKQYNQEDLWTLQKDGVLTLDKLISIATALTKATGKPAMRGDITASMVHSMFARSAGVSTITRKENTLEFSSTVNSTEYVNAFKKAQELITNGILSDGLDSSSWTYSREIFNAGELPILMGSEDIVGAYKNSDFDVGMCVMPAADGEMVTMASVLHWCAIPYNTKNTQDVALIWNQMTDVTFDVDYKLRYQDLVSEDAMELINTLSKIQTTTHIPVNYSIAADVATDSIMNQMITGAISPAQALQTIEPLYDAALKAYLE